MARIVHFEIPADNPEQQMEFFTNVFGWKFEKWGEQPYWMITTGPDESIGINGGLMARENEHHRVTNTLDVDSIDATIPKIEAAGGVIILPKQPVGDMGFVAYFKDPEHNVHGIWETVNKG